MVEKNLLSYLLVYLLVIVCVVYSESDMIIWYSTTDYNKSYESKNKNGSIFLNGFYHYLRNYVGNNDLSINKLQLLVNKYCQNYGNSVQIPEYINRCHYDIYFKSNSNVTI